MLKDLRVYREGDANKVVNIDTLEEIKLPSILREKIERHILEGKLRVNPYTAYSNTSTSNYAVMPNQIFRFACEIYDFAFDVMAYFDVLEKIRLKVNLVELFSDKVEEIRDKILSLGLDSVDALDAELLAHFISFPKVKNEKNEYRLGAKSLFNKSDGGKVSVRSYEDCFGSVVLTMVNLPNSSSSIFGDLVYSLVKNRGLYDEIVAYFASVKKSETLIECANFKFNISKPFLLLAGISGTGKTRFVREQAKASGQFNETYCLTSVRPDWHEPSDLLGYISRLNGAAEYITTDVLQFVAKAWRGIADAGLSIEAQSDRLVVSGGNSALQTILPYWLCLDEMNLAPVEQYFADYLSVLETREWQWDGEAFTYGSDALLKPSTISAVADKSKLRVDLGFESSRYDELWQLICDYGLAIPFNLMVAGTVNMDETTHGFSRKVIDRALSFDFGAFFPNDYDDFFTPSSCNKRLSYPIWSQASKADLVNTIDTDGSQTVAFLSAVNAVLKNTPFELAFRALNELLLAVVSSQPKDELTLKAVWDDFMMCKVLPRIEGDADKLTTSGGKALLVELNTVLAEQLSPIWQAGESDDANQRPDLYRERVTADGATDEEKVLPIPCRSKAKLKWMSDRLTSATFTSFWP